MKKNVIFITGPAGSGLSSAEYVLEELGYFVVKNVPVQTINSVLDAALASKKIKNICFSVHAIMARDTFEAIKDRKDANYRKIVLNCDIDELSKRYALTRRVHPRSVMEKISPIDAASSDIRDILSIVNQADFYIDTTSLTVKQLRAKLYKYISNVEEDKIASVTFISFGIKNGIPQGIDCFFDVRLIPNPYWVEDLKELTGEDQKVIDYMRSFPITDKLLKDLVTYLTDYLKEMQKSGRGSYTIGIACSGGQHRSTYVANYLAEYFSKDYRTTAIHRDTPILNEEE